MFRAGSDIRVIGHRGAAGAAPENTVVSMERAIRGGAQAIEVDVHVSADGRLVAIHDDTVDRTTDGSGPVESMTLDEIRRLDAGYRFTPDRGRSFPYRKAGVRVPTLDEAAAAAVRLPMILEVKSRAAGEALGTWLRARRADPGDADRFIVAGFEREMVAPAADAADWRSATRADLIPFVLLGKLGIDGPLPPHVDAIMVPIRKGPLRLVTRAFVRRAHERGVGVFVWTVNRPSVMRELFDIGVDGLISDVPARLDRVVAELVAGSLHMR
ncbi:MAG: glycerophosphodiester phosphodiesterase family protein [Gemmatimonadota bacterium]